MSRIAVAQESPDAICEAYAKKRTKLTVNTAAHDADTIIIEGDRDALEFLGKLLLAQAEMQDCGFHLGPRQAGQALFSDKSTKGLYIHRLPCEHLEARVPRTQA